jgi:hypothetical protein
VNPELLRKPSRAESPKYKPDEEKKEKNPPSIGTTKSEE